MSTDEKKPRSPISSENVAWEDWNEVPRFGVRFRHLTSAAIGEDVVVDGSVLRRGKELAYVDVGVRTDAGKAIAKGLVTHRVVPAGRPEAALAHVEAAVAGGIAGIVLAAHIGLPVLGQVPRFAGDHVGSLRARGVNRPSPSVMRWTSLR